MEKEKEKKKVTFKEIDDNEGIIRKMCEKIKK